MSEIVQIVGISRVEITRCCQNRVGWMAAIIGGRAWGGAMGHRGLLCGMQRRAGREGMHECGYTKVDILRRSTFCVEMHTDDLLSLKNAAPSS